MPTPGKNIVVKDGKRIVKQVRILLDQDEKDERSIEEWLEAVGRSLGKFGHVTVTGSNYLILEPEKARGDVCRPEDFDPETRDFKPGRVPPPYAQSDAVKERIKREQFSAVKNPPHLLTVEETLSARKLKKDRASNGKPKRGSVPTVYREPVEDDEVIEFSEEDFKQQQDKAETEVTDAASAVAGAFKKRLRKK